MGKELKKKTVFKRRVKTRGLDRAIRPTPTKEVVRENRASHHPGPGNGSSKKNQVGLEGGRPD